MDPAQRHALAHQGQGHTGGVLRDKAKLALAAVKGEATQVRGGEGRR